MMLIISMRRVRVGNSFMDLMNQHHLYRTNGLKKIAGIFFLFKIKALYWLIFVNLKLF